MSLRIKIVSVMWLILRRIGFVIFMVWGYVLSFKVIVLMVMMVLMVIIKLWVLISVLVCFFKLVMELFVVIVLFDMFF